MARIQSERTRGTQPPKIDYKIGNGGVRDLFKYIFGGQEARDSMKIVKTFRGKKTVIKDVMHKNVIADSLTETINNSNQVSRMAGERASQIQTDMLKAMEHDSRRLTASDVTNQLREAATYPPGYTDTLADTLDTRPDPIQKEPFIRAVDFRAYEPPSDVYPRGETPHTLPEKPVKDPSVPTISAAGPTKMRPMRGYSPLGMAGETNIVDRSKLRRDTSESYARDPIIRVEDERNFFGEGQVGFNYGGKVKTKRKKRLYKGGKVTSYNY